MLILCVVLVDVFFASPWFLFFCYLKRKIICLKEEVLFEDFASWCQGFGYMFGFDCTKSVTMPDYIDVDNF